MGFYIFILIVLFGTAFTDLIVGVSNDAVNFLNSATGSKAAKRRTIMIVAGLGVLIGTTFSSGMMEVARKGIFHPEYYTMHEVMIIFLGVMITDVLLLDLYNTFALPTSTTVSIVFEIFGGAVAIGLIKLSGDMQSGQSLLDFINTKSVIKIVSGIGLSIVFAFIFGLIIQYLTRVIFTFDYQKNFKRFGSIYCGLALMAITYFILIKGAKGSSLMTDENALWIKSHIKEILLFSFLGWTVIWQMVLMFTKVNVLKIIVLIGTFALALAFAGNDLVNFIGAPLGALGAFRIGAAAGGDPRTILMTALNEPVQAMTWILLIAGAVMMVTLWRSKKAKSVNQTSIDLGRQSEGNERFESSALARSIVRMWLSMSDLAQKIIPARIRVWLGERTNPENFKPEVDANGDAQSFDLLRAAVNLMVAAGLVSFATSLKLPLSTTFVTFMVAMATSLADKSWGRESAVYRVNGVLTVIGGWFFTAFMAFAASFLFSTFIYHFELPAIIVLLILAVFFFYRSSRVHQRREEKMEKGGLKHQQELADLGHTKQIVKEVVEMLGQVQAGVHKSVVGVCAGDRKKLKSALKLALEVKEDSRILSNDMFNYMKMADEFDSEAGPAFSRTISAIEVIAANYISLTRSLFEHIENNHQMPEAADAAELVAAEKLFSGFICQMSDYLENNLEPNYQKIQENATKFHAQIKKYQRNQIKRVKKQKAGTRRSLLFVTTVSRFDRMAQQVAILGETFTEMKHVVIFGK